VSRQGSGREPGYAAQSPPTTMLSGALPAPVKKWNDLVHWPTRIHRALALFLRGDPWTLAGRGSRRAAPAACSSFSAAKRAFISAAFAAVAFFPWPSGRCSPLDAPPHRYPPRPRAQVADDGQHDDAGAF